MRVVIDLDLCVGHGQCVDAAPDVFDVLEGESVATVLMDQPPEELRQEITLAVGMCPAAAIHVED